MTIVMYCAASAGQSPAPGVKSLVVRLVPILGPQSPNAANFKDGQGTGALELQNVSPAVAAAFEAGATYNVTIDPASPA